MELKNKKVIVAGMGMSGVAAMRTLVNMGAEVSLYDKKKPEDVSEEVKMFAEQHNLDCFWDVLPSAEKRFDYLVISPGIPLTEDIAVYGSTYCAEVLGELELAYRISKGRFIAITGTNGKTTTTSLVGRIMDLSGRDNHIVGNIGAPVVTAAEQSGDNTWFTAEVSSFQLETIKEFKPVVSALLNITPDHLNRHKTMEGYAEAKAAVFKNQTEENYFIVNKDCPISWKLRRDCHAVTVPFSRTEELGFGCFVRNSKVVIVDKNKKEIEICDIGDIQMPGSHNLENVLAAAAISYFAGVTPEIIRKGIKEFEGVEHRIEFVKEINGVKYYNDSKGTNTDASKKAIDALKENIILIAGGYDKKESFDSFIEYFAGRVKHMYLIGATAPIIAKACDEVGFSCYSFKENMEECVESAYELAESGDVVLLSPACASWDMYKNFEIRGRHFKDCVKSLGGK